MKIRWPTDLRSRVALYALAASAVLAAIAPFARLLPVSLLTRMPTFHVTSGADAGPGSLRAAIVDADRADGRARIVIDVPAITLATALPPLVNPSGVLLESRESAPAQIDGTLVTGAVLDVAAPGSTISTLRIAGGRVGVVVRADRTTVAKASITTTDVGVFVGEGAADVRIEQSTFEANRIGVQVASGSSGVVTAQGNRFAKNVAAGIWAAFAEGERSAQLVLADNQFREDGLGIIVVGAAAEIERNVFDDIKGNAIHAAAARVVLKGNTVRAGLRFGMYLERVEAGRIEQNDVVNNCSGGIMLRHVSNARVERNQLFQNGHGLVVMEGSPVAPNALVDNLVADQMGDGVLLLGASATLVGNRVVRNRHTGLHVSSTIDTRGRSQGGKLFFDRNVVAGNGRDEDHDQYRAPPDAAPSDSPAADCGWRKGTVGLLASAGVLR